MSCNCLPSVTLAIAVTAALVINCPAQEIGFVDLTKVTARMEFRRPPSAQRSNTTTPCATSAGGETSPWRIYIDRSHHFCFRYPGSYTPITHPKPMCRGPKLADKQSGANIDVCALDEDFGPAALMEMAPTGIDSPPRTTTHGREYVLLLLPSGRLTDGRSHSLPTPD